jgi:hypothetical protein
MLAMKYRQAPLLQINGVVHNKFYTEYHTISERVTLLVTEFIYSLENPPFVHLTG